MILFHGTSRKRAVTILEEGFRDGKVTYSQYTLAGVRLSQKGPDKDRPGVETFLEVDTNLSESELSAYEWIEEGREFREFFVPALIVNSRSSIRMADGFGIRADDHPSTR
jgi:hypothetical protein